MKGEGTDLWCICQVGVAVVFLRRHHGQHTAVSCGVGGRGNAHTHIGKWNMLCMTSLIRKFGMGWGRGGVSFREERRQLIKARG